MLGLNACATLLSKVEALKKQSKGNFLIFQDSSLAELREPSRAILRQKESGVISQGRGEEETPGQTRQYPLARNCNAIYGAVYSPTEGSTAMGGDWRGHKKNKRLTHTTWLTLKYAGF